MEVFTKYSASFLKYIARHNNGVGRPPAARREQLFQQSCKMWGYTHPRTCALAATFAKYGDVHGES